MIPDKLLDILTHEGVVAIVTQGPDMPHVVNTWNSYVQVNDNRSLLIPAGFMNKTEENINQNNNVLLTLGSREVDGFRGPGTGFLINGTAEFHKSGPKFETVKQRFPWARAALEISIIQASQTL